MAAMTATVKSVLSSDTVSVIGTLKQCMSRSRDVHCARFHAVQVVLRGRVVGNAIPKERVLHLEGLSAPRIGNRDRPDEVSWQRGAVPRKSASTSSQC